MSDSQLGRLAWFDLTVDNASEVRDFYQSVMGWKVNPVSMGEYEDYSMQAADNGEDVAGVCHRRGDNADMPASWMLYFIVEDLDTALECVAQHGGERVTPVKSFGNSRYAVVRDPGGAYCALYQE